MINIDKIDVNTYTLDYSIFEGMPAVNLSIFIEKCREFDETFCYTDEELTLIFKHYCEKDLMNEGTDDVHEFGVIFGVTDFREFTDDDLKGETLESLEEIADIIYDEKGKPRLINYN